MKLEFSDLSPVGLGFTDIYKLVLDHPEIQKEFVKYRHLYHSLYAINARFQPAGTGPQCGNVYAEREWLKLCTELSNAKIARFES
jgi:hypothetical protein